jgi:nitroimidazol reductase NimA-like FMN-containing flavoprotein (pyridoxamine 5'-phosphate oxidase superfamily)
MRRTDKAGTERDSDRLLREAPVCRVGFSGDRTAGSVGRPGDGGAGSFGESGDTAGAAAGGFPYVVPLFFAWDGENLYVHCAKEGEKLRRLARDDRVCVEIDEYGGVVPASRPCGFSTRYRSLIAFGRAVLVEEEGEKQRALEELTVKYGGAEFAGWRFESQDIERVAVLRIRLEELSVKQSRMG